MTAVILNYDSRVEVRQPDLTGHLVALAEYHRGEDEWEVYTELTPLPRIRPGVAKLVNVAATKRGALDMLRTAWPDAIEVTW